MTQEASVWSKSKAWTPTQIKNLRKKLKMTGSEFARALAFTGKNAKITVFRWESGLRTPSPQTIELMKQLNE